jgi:hypothetical protein
MSTCIKCIYYNVKNERHICACPKMIYGYGDIKCEDDYLLIEDDEGWGMQPGPNFGCIHWESKCH